MKKKILLLITIILFSCGIKVNAATLANSEVDIYALNPVYQSKISIPSNIAQSYKIVVNGAKGTPTYYTSSSSINVSDDGTVTPILKTWYCNSYQCSTGEFSGYTYTKQQYSFDDYIVKVFVDGQTLDQKINLKSYATLYSQQYMQDYLNKNITSDMTEYQKMEVIAKFVASYPYSTNSTSYVGFILGDGGDCIASTNTIVYMAGLLGIKAHSRYAVNDPGAGNNHHNAAAILDGKLYIIEAGYGYTSAPRPYDLTVTVNGLSHYYTKGFYQYDGYDEILNIPAMEYNDGRLADVKLRNLLVRRGLHSETKVHTINVPSNAVLIEGGAFSGVSTVKNINIDPQNEHYKSVDNVVYSKDGSLLVSYPAGKEATSFVIPTGVTTVDEQAFIYADKLKSVTIPNTVTTIKRGAFESTSISDIIVPSSVEVVEEYAFNSYYGQLNYITFLNKDVTIGEGAVYNTTTIIGYSGSTAEAYAKANGNNFIALTSTSAKPITSSMISGIQDSILYDGTNKLPILISDGSYILKEGTDYTLSYTNNTNVDTAILEIKGKGNYYGYFRIKYKITAKPIEFQIASTTLPYSRNGVNLNITTNVTGVKPNIYYIRPDYSNVMYSSLPYRDVGTHQVKIQISALNYQTVEQDITYTVVASDINQFTISYNDTYEYTGSAITPSIYLRDSGYILKKDTDYTITYKDNINAGTASMIITGIGNYAGVKKCTFQIVANTNLTLNKIYNQYSTETSDSYKVNINRYGSYGKMRIYFNNYDQIKGISITDVYGYNVYGNSGYDNARRQYYYQITPQNSGTYKIKVDHDANISYGIGVYQNGTTNSNVLDEVNRIASTKTNNSIPVYRMYNKDTGEHLYTTDAYEVSVIYTTQGWGYEGVAWYSDGTGVPVYRLFQPQLGNHLYTTDLNEVNVITTTQGWVKDFDGAPVMYSSGGISIYRLFNSALRGMHHWTTDQNEYNVLPSEGWQQEGDSFKAIKLGSPSPTEYYYVQF